ncbi:serine/threonine-protein kinase Tao-like [Corticium candelabrum]|uniref:serine/threonine-protein kinase Tao-like n=1 Tax=Corticium candelabrum TaxID=121492 RepID=UPI002E34AE57|nr:serine/threonine-protein kinase Tao-like [Corticium candelabrum]
MKHVGNGDLESMLLSEEREHPEVRKWSCRLKMSLEIAKGMDFLHSLNPSIIHRDLKTANVSVDCNYFCKIIDFGLSTMRGISRRSAVQSSSISTVMGTVAFTAPEVFLDKVEKKQETKIDVYSFSIILRQLKEMKPVYATMSSAVIHANVLANQRPKLSDNNCSKGFRQLITRCWSDQPDSRLDFGEIITMFEGIIGQTSISCNQSSRGGIDNLATEVDTASMLLDSFDESNLGSTASSSVSTLSDVVPHSGSSRAALSNTVFGSSPSRTSTTLPFTSSVSSVTQSEFDIPTTASVNFLPSLLSLSLHERSGPIMPRVSYGMGGFLDPLPVKNIVAVEESADRIGDTLLHGHHDLDNRLSFVETAQQKPGRIAEEEAHLLPKRWTQLPQLPKRHGFLNCIGTVKGKVVVSGFYNLYLCDILSSDKATVPKSGARIQTVFTANDCLFATYYLQRNSGTGWSLKIVHMILIITCGVISVPWKLGHNWNASVLFRMVTKIYIIGGEYQSGTLGNVLIYDMRRGQQSVSAKLKQARKLCRGLIIDNMLCVVGG